MKYCSKCKKLVFDESKKCECGKKLSENVDLNQPVVFTVSDDVKKGIIEHALVKAKIPYSVNTVNNSISVVGNVEIGDHIFYVPISFLKKSIDTLSGISAMEIPDYYDKLDLPENPEWEEMSPTKRNAVKILSAIGFIIIVYLCVAGVDFLANLFSKMIH